MSQSLGSIYVELSANTAKFVDGLSKAAYVAQQTSRSISVEFSSLQRVASQTFGAFGSFNPVISQLTFAISQAGRASADAMKEFGKMGGSIGALASITAGASAAMVSVGVGTIALAMHAADSAAKLYEQSQATGVSTEALSGLSFAAKQSGVATEAMVIGLERMSRSAYAAATAPAGATNAYTRLGISVKDSANQMRPTESIFNDISTRFAAMADGPAKTALAIQIFGRSGAELIPILNKGGDAIEQLTNAAKRYGIVISGETAAAAEKFQMTLGMLSAAAGGASVTLMSDLLPSLQAIASAFQHTAENGHTTLENMSEWTAEFVKGSLGVINTFLHGFEQIGLVIEAVGHSIYASFQVIAAEAKIAQQVSILDFSGAEATAKQGLRNVTSVFTDFWADTKQNWKDNADFINSLTFHPDFTLTASVGKIGDVGISRSSVGPQGGGFVAGEGWLERNRPPGGADASAADGQKKLAEALKSITEKLREEAATAGSTAAQIEQYRLTVLNATPAQHAFVAALQQTANAAEIAAGRLGNFNMKPLSGTAAAIALESLRDKYAGLSTAGAAWVASLKEQGDGLSALVNAAGAFPSQNLFQGIGPTLQQSTSESAAATIKSLQEQMSNFGKKDPTAGLGFAASAEQIAEVQKLNQEFEILQAGGTLQWVAKLNSENVDQVQAWDKAALASTNFGDRSRAMLNELIIQTESLGEKITKTFSSALNDATGELAKMVVTGKHEFTKLAESMSESLLKASFQSSISQFMTLIVGKPKVPGQGADASGVAAAAATQHSALSSIAAGIGKAFGVKSLGAAGHGPLGTAGDPLYVAFSNVSSGAVDPLGIGKLPLSKSAGLSGAIGGSLNGMAAFSNILANLPKSSASQNPFGDFGGSLQQAPAAPGGADSNSSTGARTLGTLSSVSSLAHSGVELGQDMAKLWPKIASIFGGFLANGGDVTPGHAYIVGEKHPEFFVPKTAGTVSPSMKMGSAGGVTNNFHMHVHGVHDADSFRRSQTQIYSGMHAQLAHANSRNG